MISAAQKEKIRNKIRDYCWDLLYLLFIGIGWMAGIVVKVADFLKLPRFCGALYRAYILRKCRRHFIEGKLYAYQPTREYPKWNHMDWTQEHPIYLIFLGFKDDKFFENPYIEFLVGEKVNRLFIERIYLDSWRRIN